MAKRVPQRIVEELNDVWQPGTVSLSEFHIEEGNPKGDTKVIPKITPIIVWGGVKKGSISKTRDQRQGRKKTCI